MIMNINRIYRRKWMNLVTPFRTSLPQMKRLEHSSRNSLSMISEGKKEETIIKY